MKASELNKLLVENFPDLQEKYIEESKWKEGDDTGSHIIYERVFTPYVLECIEKNRNRELARCFDFLETLLELEDGYVNKVIPFSVFKSMKYLFTKNDSFRDLLHKKSKKLLTELEAGGGVYSQTN